jgi:uncharacterized membrane protein YcaP (DUF421 family)
MKSALESLVGLDWSGILVPGISVLEKILRPLIVYLLLVVALRAAGKRELAQLNNFDFVVLLLLSNSVQNAIIGPDDSVIGGIVGALALLAANYLVVRFFSRHPRLEESFEGSPDLLIDGGAINRERLAKELITETDLAAAARKQGIESLAEVERAELDQDGGLFFARKETQPAVAGRDEIIARLDGLAAELKELRSELRRRPEA